MALVSFKNDIQPLFRARDVQCMAGAVDLNSYDDVKAKADEIYVRLTTTDPGAVMPPDGWPAGQIATFKAWVDGGCQA